MQLLLLDDKYDAVAIVDNFESIQWVDRFNTYGEFEINIPAPIPVVNQFKTGQYLYSRHTDRYMIIEEITIITDPDNGDMATIKGRSLESILERRVVWNFTLLSGSFQDAIKTLLNENVISPKQENRKIPNFTFKPSEDKKITDIQLKDPVAYQGENLYETISSLCSVYEVGFKILPSGEGGFEFSLYAGTDRSYSQDDLPWIVFSHKYENLLSSNYCKNVAGYKNVALVLGEEDAETKIKDSIEVKLDDEDKSEGLARIELTVESSARIDESEYPNENDFDEDGDGSLNEQEQVKYDEAYKTAVEASKEAYNSEMKSDGRAELAEAKITEVFDGELETRNQFIYGRDFFMGDIVQIVNKYGREARCRVTELALTEDASGESTIPSFVKVEEKEEDEAKDEDK